MTPPEIAEYADAVLDALEAKGWRNTQLGGKLLQIALREKLRQEGNKGTL